MKTKQRELNKINEQLRNLDLLEDEKKEIIQDYFNPLKIIQGYRREFERNLEEVSKLKLKGDLAYYYLQKNEMLSKYPAQFID